MKLNLLKIFKHTIHSTGLLLVIVGSAKAQDRVGIGIKVPDKSAVLHIFASDKGLLIPRINLETVTDNVAIIEPENSLIVYNTNPLIKGGTGTGYYYNAGTKLAVDWQKIATNENAWLTFGNTGLDNTKFVGTTDNRDMPFRRKNEEAFRVTPGGAIFFSGNPQAPHTSLPKNIPLMAWLPTKGAFRAGVAINNAINGTSPWASDKIGKNSVAIGLTIHNSGAQDPIPNPSGDFSTAIGAHGSVTGFAATSIGGDDDQSPDFSFAMNGHLYSDKGLGGKHGAVIGGVGYGAGEKAFSLGSAFGVARGSHSSVIGGHLSQAEGNFSATIGGLNVISFARGSLAVGIYNDLVVADPVNTQSNDRVFEIGVGIANNIDDPDPIAAVRRTALIVQRDGDMVIKGVMNAKNGLIGPSDIRLKEEIKALQNVMNKIDKIQPVYFNYKEGTGYSADHQLGFIAQEIEAQFPELVKKNEEGYLAVNYPGMTAVAIEAIKEQQAVIESSQHTQKNTQQHIDSQATKITDNAAQIQQLLMDNRNLEKRARQLEKKLANDKK